MRLLREEFELIYGKKEEPRVFFAPGRVNLIGEHIDYNGGHVLPCALEIGTYAVARQREDRTLAFYSHNFPDNGIITVSLDDLSYREEHAWANYPKGLFHALQESLGQAHGFDLFFYGNIPNGSGLSSSASIELVTAVLLNNVFDLGLSKLDLVKISQNVENQYIGVNCGIMDQFSIGFGERDQAILLNCETYDYRYVPLVLGDHSIVIANTNKKRGLADSAYNERRQTCEDALKKIAAVIPVTELAHLKVEQLESVQPLLTEEEFVRVRHVVTENARTLEAVDVLEQGDLVQFGKLMKASHESLRDDYEVSCVELDTLVDAAAAHVGTLGARMTGAGFGGCTVNIVKDSETASFIKEVGETYKQAIGYDATFYTVKVGTGAREITSEITV